MEAWNSERRTLPVPWWDGFLCLLFDHDLKSLGPGIRFGDIGDDALHGGASVFGDNYLLAGISKGKLGQNLGYDLSGNGESPVAFLSVYGSAEFSAKVWPEPLRLFEVPRQATLSTLHTGPCLQAPNLILK